MATVSVVVRTSPFGTRRAAEALRMSVGQTLADNRVRVIFAGDAVYMLGDVKPETIGGITVQRPLEALRMLGHTLVAESESLDERGIVSLPAGIRRESRAEIAMELLESDVVIAW